MDDYPTTQTRVLIVEKFYAIANITVYFGGIGRGRECTPPMNHCCPPPNHLKKVPKQCYVFKATYASPLHKRGGGGYINPLVEDNGVPQAVPLSN